MVLRRKGNAGREKSEKKVPSPGGGECEGLKRLVKGGIGGEQQNGWEE